MSRESDRKWEENQKVIRQMLDNLTRRNQEHDDRSIGALGVRWSEHTEQSLRGGLRAILQNFSNVQVIRVNEWDDDGEVFGRPDEIDLDLIVRDDLLLIVEVRASMSRSEMHFFRRKADFYMRRHQRQADRLLVISPMVEARARELAEELGIEVYSYVEELEPELLGSSS